MDKTQVIGSLLTTVETSLDTITLVLEGNISEREMVKYRKKMERLGRTIVRLTGIIDGNTNYGELESQMGSIINKYRLLTSIVG